MNHNTQPLDPGVWRFICACGQAFATSIAAEEHSGEPDKFVRPIDAPLPEPQPGIGWSPQIQHPEELRLPSAARPATTPERPKSARAWILEILVGVPLGANARAIHDMVIEQDPHAFDHVHNPYKNVEVTLGQLYIAERVIRVSPRRYTLAA